jgi:maltose O-acetyltransferase
MPCLNEGFLLRLLDFPNRVRLLLLVRSGLKIGENVYVSKRATIDATHPELISIGDDCTITDGVCILAHDASGKKHGLAVERAKVTIGNKTFIGVNTTILPGVTIGSNVIIGAGSVVVHDIPSDSVAFGNPATAHYSVNMFCAKRKGLERLATA